MQQEAWLKIFSQIKIDRLMKLNHKIASKSSIEYSSSRLARNRLLLTLNFRLLFWPIMLTAICLKTAKLAGVLSFLIRLLSSLKATSSTQCREFSIDQWLLIASASFLASLHQSWRYILLNLIFLSVLEVLWFHWIFRLLSFDLILIYCLQPKQ